MCKTIQSSATTLGLVFLLLPHTGQFSRFEGGKHCFAHSHSSTRTTWVFSAAMETLNCSPWRHGLKSKEGFVSFRRKKLQTETQHEHVNQCECLFSTCWMSWMVDVLVAWGNHIWLVFMRSSQWRRGAFIQFPISGSSKQFHQFPSLLCLHHSRQIDIKVAVPNRFTNSVIFSITIYMTWNMKRHGLLYISWKKCEPLSDSNRWTFDANKTRFGPMPIPSQS